MVAVSDRERQKGNQVSNTYTDMLARVAGHSDELFRVVRDALAGLGTGIDIEVESADGYRRWAKDQATRKKLDLGPNDFHPTLWTHDSVSEAAREKWEAEQAKRAKEMADKRRVIKAKRIAAITRVQRAIAAGKATVDVEDLESFGASLVGERCYFSSGGFISASESAEDGQNAQSDTVAIVAAMQRGYVAWEGRPRSGDTYFTAPLSSSESSDSAELVFDS